MKREYALLFVVAAATSCSRAKSDASTTQGPAIPGELLTGEAALGDWTTDAPGVRRKITAADLPAPFATKSVDNGANVVARPEGASPRVPDGFKVAELVVGDLRNPRQIRVAPNGDLFVVESKPNRVRVVRDADGDGKPEAVKTFASGLNQPFGVAFWPPDKPQYVYIANTGSVVRFAYTEGDMEARGGPETIVPDISAGGQLRGGGHWTRDVVFSKDGKKMFVSIGSKSNVSDNEEENQRARIFEFDPDGKNGRVYATGIRNPVGLAVHPDTGDLYTAVNERDELGDHLVPDYVTRVKDGGFYGWPWFYIGGNQDPRHGGKRADLKASVLVPDVLVQSHSATLGITFVTSEKFPTPYRNVAFVAAHGSWNRARRTGYKVIAIPMQNGAPTGEYVDFLTGFVTASGDVWGRPVGVAQSKDGALYVSDDGGNVIWRVTYGP